MAMLGLQQLVPLHHRLGHGNHRVGAFALPIGRLPQSRLLPALASPGRSPPQEQESAEIHRLLIQ